ncbi:hypothetical protein DR64_789 [Paraburkholderia xenovorans LB400]|nr:hypothetical protein [Paraburkholderia xenovorans]AIP31891.1 hypothetical protein DR64_789 [Paraburkholderia xenovorans LB400]
MEQQLNKEQVYDTQISPLMAQIIEICKANKIPFIASFSIPTEDDPELACSSAILNPEFNPPASLVAAWREIRPARGRSALMLRTEHADGSTTLTAIVG